MSLINQMLKDLEQRNAAAEGLKPLAGEVRTVHPKPSAARGRWFFLGAAVLVLVAAGAWWQLQIPPPAQMPVAKPQQVPLPPPAATPAPPPPSPAVLPAPEKVTVGQIAGLDRELRTAHSPEAPAGKTDAAPEAKLAPGAEPAGQPLPDKHRERNVLKPLPASPGVPLKLESPQQKSENLYRQAVSLLQQGRVSEARAALDQALQENAANHHARQLLVGLLLEGKQADEALSLLQEGVRMAPEQSGFVMALARLQVDSGDFRAALQTMEQGAKFAGEDADFAGFLAALLQRNERHAEAIPQYLTALRGDPANISWLVGLGISLEAENRGGEAREAYERAQQLGPLTPELSEFVAQRLRRLKDK